MKRLDLDKCKTNEEVCKLISDRVNEITFHELLNEVNKVFIYQEEATKAIYTGLSMNMNVFLSGPGGYGKSALIKFILEFYNIPYHSIVGYKDMPVDALLGIPDMDKLLNKSEYEINFKKSIFYKPGILVGEEFTDILPSTAAALKDILTEKGFRDKNGKTESLISSMIIAANKSALEVTDDESKKAFYSERFPIKVEVIWKYYSVNSYFKFLKNIFKDVKDSLLFFMASLFEKNHSEYNNTISPRTAINITKVYINKGIKFINHFDINTDSIDNIKKNANLEYNKRSFRDRYIAIDKYISVIQDREERRTATLYILFKLNVNKITDGQLLTNIEFKEKFNTLIKYELSRELPYYFNDIDKILNS